MRSLGLIFRREFAAYWTSPIAYVVLSMYLILTGFFFFGELSGFVSMVQRGGGSNVDVNQQLIRSYLNSISVILLFLLPLVTMRLVAEDRRQGTLEILLTTPIREIELVAGKYLASLGLFGAMLLGPAVHVALLFAFGNPDPAPVLTGFLGVFLTGAVYLALGLFFSTLTQNQVVAATASFSLFLFLWLCAWVGRLVSGTAGEVLREISLAAHFESFGRGILDSSDLVYYFSWIAAGLYAATQSVLAARWKP